MTSPVKYIEIDFTEFAHYLEGADISDEEAGALMRSLWDIAIVFVDLGWEVSAPDLPPENADITARNLANFIKNEVELKPAIVTKEGIEGRLAPCFDEAG